MEDDITRGRQEEGWHQVARGSNSGCPVYSRGLVVTSELTSLTVDCLMQSRGNCNNCVAIKQTATELLKKHGGKTLPLVVRGQSANDPHLACVCIQAELNE